MKRPEIKNARVERERATNVHSMKIVYKVQNAQSVKHMQACRIIVSKIVCSCRLGRLGS